MRGSQNGTYLRQRLLDLYLPLLSHIQHQQLARINNEGYDTRKDEHGDEDGREGIETCPSVAIDEERRDDDADRSQCICHNVLQKSCQ